MFSGMPPTAKNKRPPEEADAERPSKRPIVAADADDDAFGRTEHDPDTDLLKEQPEEYTLENALTDLVDIALQDLWYETGRMRLLSVELHRDRLTIFDSGPGMDGADGNLMKWGKRGSSLQRLLLGQEVGQKPPYLMPSFDKYGCGGPVAAMCLGKRAVISSKTKDCNKVFTLHLEKEELTSVTKTKWEVRDPSEDDNNSSNHGSFTKVEIFDLRKEDFDVGHLRCRLKDIYFPYIQCDDTSGKTSRPVKFQVNGDDLVGIHGGKVATTNLHSCNGPNFDLQLRFNIKVNQSSTPHGSRSVPLSANARLKCVYFPIVEGVESIKKIIDKLDADYNGNNESFEEFSRVSVRWLGRLLPDARWASLPFMDSEQEKGEKGQMAKRCYSRVICFIDTDSGFDPTPLKTDLDQNHPYTKALKNFSYWAPGEKKAEVSIIISRDGKKLAHPQLKKQYKMWINEMHAIYDKDTVVPSKNNRPPKSRIYRNIDTKKGILVDIERENTHNQELPYVIEILSGKDCADLELYNEGGLPSVVRSDEQLPDHIVAVIRSKNFDFTLENSSIKFDQESIVVDNTDMCLTVKLRVTEERVEKFEYIYSTRVSPCSHLGVRGFYLFPMKSKQHLLFKKAGCYTFSFCLSSLEDVKVERVVQVHVNDQGVGILPTSPSLNISPLTRKDSSPRSSNEHVLPINWSPSTNIRDENTVAAPSSICLEDIENDLAKCKKAINAHETNLVKLGIKLSLTQERISLQDSVCDPVESSMSGKVSTLKQIESKKHSAAAVICKLDGVLLEPTHGGQIFGVVALLGAASSIELSRILAQYLGEDNMLAIVCIDYEAARHFRNNILSPEQQSMTGEYLTICLEDIRRDSIPLQKPRLSNGYLPEGFLGYAAEMMSIGESHFQWRSKSGHSLEETLFYRLFGELQVYENKSCMTRAKSCIKFGAVSLDGCIFRGNGIFSFGHREPDILFPVQDEVMIESVKMLRETQRQIDKETRSLERENEKLPMLQDRFKKAYMSHLSQETPPAL